MSGAWSDKFKDGDRVEWVGPEDPSRDYPPPGTQGNVITSDSPDEWVVRWDLPLATAVYPERYLTKVEDAGPDDAPLG